jgi:predicted GIY-YIG superfamily endonuclease
MPYCVYILKCIDGSYYTGSTNDLGRRLYEHESGLISTAYTYSRRPVELVWSYETAARLEAFEIERQIKGWNRSKKEALAAIGMVFIKSSKANEYGAKQRNTTRK